MLQSTVSLVAVLGLVAAASAGSSAVFDPEAVLTVRNNYASRLLPYLFTDETNAWSARTSARSHATPCNDYCTIIATPPSPPNNIGLWLTQTPRQVPGGRYSPSPTTAAGFGDIPLVCPYAEIMGRMTFVFQNAQSQCIVEGDIAIIDPT